MPATIARTATKPPARTGRDGLERHLESLAREVGARGMVTGVWHEGGGYSIAVHVDDLDLDALDLLVGRHVRVSVADPPPGG